MHAVAIVQKIVRPVSAQLDVRNARNLMLAVQALVSGRRLVLMELARHWPGAERVLAPLKRLDRLLGNRDVQAVRTRFYSLAAAWLLRSAPGKLALAREAGLAGVSVLKEDDGGGKGFALYQVDLR